METQNLKINGLESFVEEQNAQFEKRISPELIRFRREIKDSQVKKYLTTRLKLFLDKLKDERLKELKQYDSESLKDGQAKLLFDNFLNNQSALIKNYLNELELLKDNKDITVNFK